MEHSTDYELIREAQEHVEKAQQIMDMLGFYGIPWDIIHKYLANTQSVALRPRHTA